ncbi:hypothetical protein QBC35DRAFT_273883 [Podospora australis]|uniref:Uncharacterized protein n=1 Tax=Podospora australis TaxID=1536484 RepID=A0AAN6WQT0_9PEZI|nr:hypothetical protein QBC35DRAFT_273883 [Podospora australis]
MTNLSRYHGLRPVDPIPLPEDPLPPPYVASDQETVADEKYDGPPRLHILAATWGGVTYTPVLQGMIDTKSQTLHLDLRNIFQKLQPDPAAGVQKVLSLVFRYDGDDFPKVLNISESSRRSITITKEYAAGLHSHASPGYFISSLSNPWRASSNGQVEILAVLYGPKNIDHPSVYEQLGNYFEGRTKQIRMTNAFFRCDPWPYNRKSWAVYFRFVNSKRVQVVTGWENQALEQPWSRY